MSAFIGHGDSDKQASTSPFAKVYDELWVAGQAGADRFRRAAVGAREDQFVYVGRPTLDSIAQQENSQMGDSGGPGPASEAGNTKTILYAPTWEGSDREQEYSSVHQGGYKMIDNLLAMDPPVRIVYKSHPKAGQRLATMSAAHKRIVERLQQANAKIADPARQHVLADKGQQSLYYWFDQADFLVTDVSSVLSDFIVTEKPYAVFNFTDKDATEFARQFPSSAAGMIFESRAESLEQLTQYISDPGTYRDGDQRRELRKYLLGDPETPAMVRFQLAVSNLVAESEARIKTRTND